jgi:hypothetical protein
LALISSSVEPIGLMCGVTLSGEAALVSADHVRFFGRLRAFGMTLAGASAAL